MIFAPLVRLNPVVTLYENGNLSSGFGSARKFAIKEYPKDVKLHNLLYQLIMAHGNYKTAAGHFRFVLY